MSMLSEQVKEIRDMAGVLYDEKRYAAQKIMRQAADTIEALSAKLSAANMERSDDYYGGGWIACKDRLPKEGDMVILQDYYGEIEIGRFGHDTFLQDGFYTDDWFSTVNNYLYWQPLPQPYQGE